MLKIHQIRTKYSTDETMIFTRYFLVGGNDQMLDVALIYVSIICMAPAVSVFISRS